MHHSYLKPSALFSSAAAIPVKSLSRYLITCFLASLVITVSAQISIPLYPVPITLQTLAIMSLSMTLGRKVGVGAIVLYLTQAVLGLPVLAGGANLLVFGPTFGYLVGFIFMAYVAGFYQYNPQKSVLHNSLKTGFYGLMSVIPVYLLGCLWLSYFVGFSGSLAIGLWPFMPGMICKISFLSYFVPSVLRFISTRTAS